MSAETGNVRVGLRQTWGWLFVAMCIVTSLSLLTYDWQDISVLRAPAAESMRNCFGPAGAWLSWLLFTAFGLAAYSLPLWFLLLGAMLIVRPEMNISAKVLWTALLMFGLTAVLDLQDDVCRRACEFLNIKSAAGGVLTRGIVRHGLVPVLNKSGTAIIAVIAVILGVLKLVGVEAFVGLSRQSAKLWRSALDGIEKWRESRRDVRQRLEKQQREIEKQRALVEEAVRKEERRLVGAGASTVGEIKPAAAKQVERPVPPPVKEQPIAVVKKPATPAAPAAPADKDAKYQLPPVSLLDPVPPAADRAIKGDVATTGRVLCETLAEFDIVVEVANVEQGPAVTRYELRPAPGVRVEKIASLSNNIALALKATSVLVQAPVPGKGVVGIEVPNTISSMVYLREILDGERWTSTTAALPVVLGKDVSGADIITDLAASPHLLIAGATGSGKTVCMNAILVGLLMSRTPDQLRLMLIDPKIVEFAHYNSIPHLIVPVITDPHKVTLGLRWAINEMEKRYKLFAKAGVRNIEGYNHRVLATQQDLFVANDEVKDEEETIPDRLPYIVIIVDELADLMLVAQADIENCIARLAQLSRAVGIHMIIATQRPSVNIITGTIKANFPARIAFQVPQRVDSRTILDSNGADKLLGSGDMLFLPPGTSKLVRAQGAMVKDHEIKKVVEFLTSQSEPDYETAVCEKMESSKTMGGNDSEADDELMEQAVQIIRETRRASTSSLQRRLRIGYTRAARLMDILEERGVVGPPRGSDPREILIDLDGDIPHKQVENENVEDNEDVPPEES